ncbi:YbjQ family protein [Paracoccus sp. PAR01]|nr:YbjQ family protein [Paracoccus sp. PAR01]
MESGVCRSCIKRAAASASEDERDAEIFAKNSRSAQAQQEDQDSLNRIILTTEHSSNLKIAERIDIITAECVIGMHVFKDLMAGARDLFGGRSATIQKGLKEARTTALTELRREARNVGADAVVGVNLSYNEISTGSTMLMVVATGTAVRLATAGWDQ